MAQAQNNYFDQAKQLEQAGQFAAAFLQYQRAFEERPNHAPSALGLLRTGLRSERWQAARQALNRYEQLNPETAQAAELGVQLYFQQEQYDTALTWAKRSRERSPGRWRPFYFEAFIQFKRQNFVATLESLESARLRTEWNPWIEWLHVRARQKLEGFHDSSRAQKLRDRANHPNLFWELANFRPMEWGDRQRAKFLQNGLQEFPAESPPLGSVIEETDYRYRLALLWNQLDQSKRATEVIGNVQSEEFEIRWLQAMLMANASERLQRQGEILSEFPDRIIPQWQHSRLARSEEGIQGTHRKKASDVFYRGFQNNQLFGYDESALSSLIRSLELQPTVARRQFELGQYFHDRGWLNLEAGVLNRVEELGLRDPTEIQDYREGINRNKDPQAPEPKRIELGLVINLSSLWQGPPAGVETMKNMLAHALHHQPAFSADRLENPGDTPTAIRLAEEGWDGAIEISINRWDQVMESTIRYHYAPDNVQERRFYARGRMKPWRFLDEIIRHLKQTWPWQGQVYKVEKPGAWINLGRVHGLEEGDRFLLNGDERVVGKIHESRLRLQFPTPVLQGRTERGTTVKRVLEQPEA